MPSTRRLRVPVAAAAVVALLAIVPASASALNLSHLLAPRSTCSGQTNAYASLRTQWRAMYCLANYARTHDGRRALRRSSILGRSAGYKLSQMDRCRRFSHTPCGHSFMSAFSTYVAGARRRWSVGENIAWGSGPYSSPRAIMNGWLHSPEHLANLLSGGFRQTGFAVHSVRWLGPYRAMVWVEDFGAR